MSCYVKTHALRHLPNIGNVDDLPVYSTSAPPKPSGLPSFMRILGLVLETFREATEMRRNAHLIRRIEDQ